MHNLEHILFATSIAVEKDEISKAELTRVLRKLASASHNYEPVRGSDEELKVLNDWIKRFDPAPRAFPRFSENINDCRDLKHESELIIEMFRQVGNAPNFPRPARLLKNNEACVGILDRFVRGEREFFELSSGEQNLFMAMVSCYNFWRGHLV